MTTPSKKQEQEPIAEPRTRGKQPDADNQVRRILAYASVALTITNVIAYIVTRDPILLGTSTAAGAATAVVFRYYFRP